MLRRIAHLTWRLARFTRHWLKEIFIALVLAVLAALLVEYYKASKERESLNRNKRAVAQVVAYKNQHQLAQGSGVFINQTGLLITNFHVIEGADQLVAKLPTGAYYQLRDIRGADRVADIAILQFDAQETPCVSGLGDSDKVEAGQRIIAIGSPLGLESSISEGVISNPKRSIAGVSFIQFTAPISSGSSGGGLFDKAAGLLLGLPSRSLAASPELQADVGVQNVNFAVPINAVKDSIDGTTTIFTEGRPEYYYSLGTIAENRHALGFESRGV